MTNTQSKIIEPNSLNEHLNFLIQNLIGTGSQIEQLKSLCILWITLIVHSKNWLVHKGKPILIDNLMIFYEATTSGPRKLSAG